MKKFMQLGLLAVACAGFGFTARAAEQKIGIFDLRKAFESYYKTKLSNVALSNEVAEAGRERAQMVENARKHQDEYRKLIDQADDQAVSAEEREKGKQAAVKKIEELKSDEQDINTFDRAANARIGEKKNMRREEIVKEIRGILEAHAIAAGYTMVFDTSGESANLVPVLLYTNGQDDLTDGVIKELNVAAPPGSLTDTNTPAAPSTASVTNTPSSSK
jgi:Skp family chaperone for outer membrane proteins